MIDFLSKHGELLVTEFKIMACEGENLYQHKKSSSEKKPMIKVSGVQV
jgi:hypothetical protein